MKTGPTANEIRQAMPYLTHREFDFKVKKQASLRMCTYHFEIRSGGGMIMQPYHRHLPNALSVLFKFRIKVISK